MMGSFHSRPRADQVLFPVLESLNLFMENERKEETICQSTFSFIIIMIIFIIIIFIVVITIIII